MMLEQFGCDTIAVLDHQSALRAVAENTVDLMLIDYHLAGGETGEQVARDVRVIRPQIPLIMLTGDSSVPPSAAESVDAVLIKGSSDPGALLELIQKLLPESDIRPRRPMLVADPPPKSTEAEKSHKAS